MRSSLALCSQCWAVYPTPEQYANSLADGKVTIVEKRAAEIINDLANFFSGARPVEIKLKLFKALSYRWGFVDGAVHKLGQATTAYDVELDKLFEAKLSLINRLGWMVNLTPSAAQKWRLK